MPAVNTAIVTSVGAPAGAVGDDCTHVSLWSAAVDGDYLHSQAISTNPDALTLGAQFQIAADELVINQAAAANEQNAMVIRKLNGAIAGGVWIQYHTGAPGADGTDNVIAIARTEIAESAWTVT